MGDSTATIPVIDFSAYRLSLMKPDTSQFQKLVDDVHKALTTIGFFFIVNTDFPQDQVDELFQVSKRFFDLPLADKKNVPPTSTKDSYYGYVHISRESLDPNRLHGDLKETFNFCKKTEPDELPKESKCPGFKTAMYDFFERCVSLQDRVLEVLSFGLKLEDPLFFVKHHNEPNMNCLRTLFYPSLDDVTVKEQQVRCGEHSDYGGITLLFQQTPGLEVCTRVGSYVRVPLVKGGILVNIGDMMQRWTSDTYISAKHRVLLDGTPEERRQTRQSIAFFGNPNIHSTIECIDNSNKYPPINSLEYLNMRFDAKAN